VHRTVTCLATGNDSRFCLIAKQVKTNETKRKFKQRERRKKGSRSRSVNFSRERRYVMKADYSFRIHKRIGMYCNSKKGFFEDVCYELQRVSENPDGGEPIIRDRIITLPLPELVLLSELLNQVVTEEMQEGGAS
jgi:hypothetical protein